MQLYFLHSEYSSVYSKNVVVITLTYFFFLTQEESVKKKAPK